jgi:hypothetical protein
MDSRFEPGPCRLVSGPNRKPPPLSRIALAPAESRAPHKSNQQQHMLSGRMTSPSSSSRRRSRAYADRPAGPSCATGKHASPAQSKRLAGTRVPPANRPRLHRVQHAAAQRARAANTTLPQQRTPVVRRGKQPPSRSKAPAPAPSRCRAPAAKPNPGRRLVTSPPPSRATAAARRDIRRQIPGKMTDHFKLFDK